jgi:hypothetical protein
MSDVGSKSSRLRYVVIAVLFWVVGVLSAVWWQVAVRGGICS